MTEDIYKYFINLENNNCQKFSGSLVRYDENFKEATSAGYNIKKTQINKTPFYLKHIHRPNKILQPIASSQLFKHCGIITPPIFITSDYDSIFQTTQDVESLPFDSIIASDITSSEAYAIHKLMAKPHFPSTLVDKWIFINNHCRHIFLEFMTPECFDQLVNLFLIDELRTEQDCHDDNYFLYKSPGSDKFEGIIRIDLDNVYITNKFDIFTLEDFKEFLEVKYHTYDPFLSNDWMSYEDRHRNLRELLESNILSDNNILTLKKALEFDFPKAIKETGKKYNLEEDAIDEIYTPIAMLWEYNRNNLGRDLEI